MQPDELAQLLRSHIPSSGHLDLSAAFLPEFGSLLKSLQLPLLSIADAKVQVANRTTFQGPLAAQVRVDGKCSLLGMNNVAATCYFATSSQLQICLQVQWPQGWKIPNGIPLLPPSMRTLMDGSSMLTLQDCLLSDIDCREVSWLVTNYAQPEAQISVGLNLVATVDAHALLSSAPNFVDAGPRLALQGSVQLSPSADTPAALTITSQPLGKPLSVGSITISDVRVRARTAMLPEVLEPETLLEVGGIIALGKPNPSRIEIWTRLYPGADTWYFLGEAQDDSLSLANGLQAIVDLIGGDTSDFHLPSSLQSVGNLHLQGLTVGLSERDVERVSLTVGSDATWALIPDLISIGNLSLGWFILSPLNRDLRYNSVAISGTLALGNTSNPLLFDMEAHSGSGFFIEASQQSGQTFHVTDVLQTVLGVETDLPALDLNQLYLQADTSSYFLLEATSPSTWQIPLGITELDFGNLALSIIRSTGAHSTTVAEISGQVSFAGCLFPASCGTQGNFSINGTLPTIDLKSLLQRIIGDVIVFPPSFPAIELVNAFVSIQKFQQDYRCQFSTAVEQWGSILIEAAKENGQWGVAAGFALPAGWKLSTLTTLPIFNDFTFDSLALVVSSFRDPGFVFPNNSVPAVSGVVEGVNFSAGLALSGPLLGTVAEVIGEDHLVIKAAIGVHPEDTFLSAVLGKTIAIPPVSNLPLSGGPSGNIVLSIQPAPLSASIAGMLTVPVGDQDITFIGATIVSVNALTFALDVEAPRGVLLAPMGFQGVNLNEIGIAMSTQFEPPSFALALEGQFAFTGQPPSSNAFAFAFASVGEEVHPQLLSCTFAELDLPIVFNACMGATITLPSVLSSVQFTDVLVYWCAIPSTLPDGTVSTPGYGFNGNMDFFGWHAFASLMITFSSGIAGKAELDPIMLGKNVLSITGKAKHGGPLVAMSTLASPYFVVSLDVSVLGLGGVDIEGQIADDGMHFSLDAHARTFLDAEVACVLSDPTHFSFSCGFRVALDLSLGPLALPETPISLGYIHVAGGFVGSLTVQLDGDTFSATIEGGIAWLDQVWSIAAIHVSGAPADVSDFVSILLSSIQEQANQIFSALIDDAEQWAKYVLDGIITGVNDIAAGLKDAYHETDVQATRILKDIGQDATAAAAALQRVYNDSLDAAAQALASVNYDADVAGNALKSAYGASADQIASALKSANYTTEQVAGALKSAYGLTSDQVASTLKGAGYTADQVASALASVYSLSADQVASALSKAGYTADQIASVLKNTFHWSASQVASYCKESLGLADTAVNSLLQGAGYAGDQINSAMHDAFSWGSSVVDTLNPENWHL